MAKGFQQTDAGRKDSKRKKQDNDCTVRTLSIALDIDYDDAYDYLAASGRKCSKGFHFIPHLRSKMNVQYETFLAVRGRPRMNVDRLVEARPTGTYIVSVAKHVFILRDGVAFDESRPRGTKCVYGVIEIVDPAALRRTVYDVLENKSKKKRARSDQRAELRRLARSMGVSCTIDCFEGTTTIELDAPRGQTFGGSHYTTADGFDDALDILRGGLDACEDYKRCDICNDDGGE